MAGHARREVMEVHHIHKRPPPHDRNAFCNLIRISDAAHDWIHDVSPYSGELACWFAKLQKWKRAREWDEISGELPVGVEVGVCVDRLQWHIPTMNRIVEPFVSFQGRVEFLTDRAAGEFKQYGEEIIEYISRGNG